jgi:hypothetical protein
MTGLHVGKLDHLIDATEFDVFVAEVELVHLAGRKVLRDKGAAASSASSGPQWASHSVNTTMPAARLLRSCVIGWFALNCRRRRGE